MKVVQQAPHFFICLGGMWHLLLKIIEVNHERWCLDFKEGKMHTKFFL